MSEQEFEETARLYAKGLISRRGFINKLVAGGVTVTAAVAFAGATTVGASRSRRPSGDVYGTPKHGTGHVYGTPKHDDEHDDKGKRDDKKKPKKR